MGLWSFLTGSGKKADDTDDSGTPTVEALTKEVESLGVDTSDLTIEVGEGKVKLSGGAMDDEMKEKVILAVGNVEGVSSVEADVASEPVFHTVEKGDTLWAIAKKTLGDGNRYNEIFEANKPMLSDPDKIYPGQVLRIPVS
jgi:nucleoid-associated protein YgaU